MVDSESHFTPTMVDQTETGDENEGTPWLLATGRQEGAILAGL